jgi:hypothetical protein
MKRLLASLAFLSVAGIVPVMAADLPAKAPAKPLAYPWTTSGWYGGLGTFASAANPTIDGSPNANLQALGGSIGAVGGYRWGSQNFAVSLEASAFYNNVGGATACQAGTCQVGAKFSSIERVKFMIDMATLTALFPNLGLGNMPLTLPPSIMPTSQRVYVFGGFAVDDVSASLGLNTGKAWQVSPGVGPGTEFLLPNGAVLDVWAGYFNPTDGISIGPSQVSQGRKYLFGANVLF